MTQVEWPSVCERSLTVWRWSSSTKWVVSLTWLCCNSGIVCGLASSAQQNVMLWVSFSCHIPAADMIKWAWLETLHLVDIFRVVYEVICAPPPMSLGSHLKVASCIYSTVTNLSKTIIMAGDIIANAHAL